MNFFSVINKLQRLETIYFLYIFQFKNKTLEKDVAISSVLLALDVTNFRNIYTCYLFYICNGKRVRIMFSQIVKSVLLLFEIWFFLNSPSSSASQALGINVLPLLSGGGSF